MSLRMRSVAFAHEEPLPRRFTGEAQDLSPPLTWSGAPPETRAYALICEDPDAPAGVWVHWVFYDMPSTVTELPEGVPPAPGVQGAKHGKNSWGELGYRGPLPPEGGGRHRYYFQLFALSAPTGLEPGATRDELLAALEGKIMARTELMGSYQR